MALLPPSAFNFPLPSAAWREVVRLCRRICLLHERGSSEAAEQLTAESLAPAVEAARLPGETDESLHARLAVTLAAERERIATAAAVLEMLLPQLVRQPLPTPGSASPLESITSPPAVRRPAASIADFIDEMIAQERRAS